MSMEGIVVRASRMGIELPEAGVWLDAHRGVGCSVVTHAHSDHVARHGKSVCSEPTARLLRDRFGFAGEIVPLRWDEGWECGGHRFVLVPAGHVLGSAMVQVTRLRDGATLLYTGDFKLRAGLSCEAARPVPADVLIMECTFGLPAYRFPDFGVVRQQIIDWCAGALERGETPVLMGYALGKAQEIQMLLGGAVPVAVHATVAAMNRSYESLGWQLPPWEEVKPGMEGRVLVVPPSAARGQWLRRRRRVVTAMVSGWALQGGARFQYQCDEVFALSDHADFPDLLRLVEMVKPQRIYATHGPAAEFSQLLRGLGWEAWSLQGSDQMELSLADAGGDAEAEGMPVTEAAGEFAAFADCCDEVAAMAGRHEKSARIAALLRGLAGDEELGIVVRFLAGRAAGTRAELAELQAGPSVIRQALLMATGLSLAAYRGVSRVQNDAGRTARIVLEGRTVPREWTLREVQLLFDRLRWAPGVAGKVAVLAEAFRGMAPREAQCVVRILTGDTRLGIREGLLEDAVADAFSVPGSELREAHMQSGDLAQVAVLARAGRLAECGMRVFQPIRVMLASPGESVDAVWEKMEAGSEGLWLEGKYDGIRAQVHVASGRCGIYSRDLREVSAQFPELLRAAAVLSDELVFDAEIIAPGLTGRADFAALQKRLGRSGPDLFLEEEIPVRCVIFDLLRHNGESLLRVPLRQRREVLESVRLPSLFSLIPVWRARDRSGLERAFLDAREAGLEGLIIKDPESPYAAGTRGRSWLKLKRSPLSLDVVVTAVQQGHGKRSHLLSDFTFAVRAADGALRNIGKAYSGLSDAELEELTEHFTRQTVSIDGRLRTVVPDTVLEVTFDSLQPSGRHDSGYALRFPRIRAWRRDKTPAEIDTMEEAARLAEVCAMAGRHAGKSAGGNDRMREA